MNPNKVKPRGHVTVRRRWKKMRGVFRKPEVKSQTKENESVMQLTLLVNSRSALTDSARVETLRVLLA